MSFRKNGSNDSVSYGTSINVDVNSFINFIFENNINIMELFKKKIIMNGR